MNSEQKAKQLLSKFGYKVANDVADLILDEIKRFKNQGKIDFWLDVKNDMRKLSFTQSNQTI